jgi:hypothetical protein
VVVQWCVPAWEQWGGRGGGARSIIIIHKMMWSLLWWRRRTRMRLNFFFSLTTGQILEWSVCTVFRLYWPRDILLLLYINSNKAKWRNHTQKRIIGGMGCQLLLPLRVSLSLDPIQPTVPNGGGGGLKVISNQPQKVVFRKISTCNNCHRSPFMGMYGLNV